MSYAPIYSKINDLEKRLTIVEASSIVPSVTLPLPSVAPSVAPSAELPDLSGFATKAELPDLSGFATKAELPDLSDLSAKFEQLLNVISQLNIRLNDANDKIAVLEAERSS
jgi:hypothetical protein